MAEEKHTVGQTYALILLNRWNTISELAKKIRVDTAKNNPRDQDKEVLAGELISFWLEIAPLMAGKNNAKFEAFTDKINKPSFIRNLAKLDNQLFTLEAALRQAIDELRITRFDDRGAVN
jgi:hypothetical protein